MPIPTAQERLGTILAERYEFTSILARGGMGVLFEGRDLRTQRPVVIKLLRTADLDDDERRARFLQEARSICRVRHPNVVEVLDCGEADSLPYLVMEHLHGQPLSELLAQRGAFDLERTLRVLLPIMGAAAHVHDAGIVHRDLKPSNIFLHEDPSGRTVPKLLDFGIAKAIDTGGVTISGVVMGTPEYMSPEQASGSAIDVRTDVWAMGVILHRCLSGDLPFRGERPAAVLGRVVGARAPSLGEIVPDLPRRLAAAIDRALEPSLARRYGHMRELAEAITVTAASAGVRLPSAPDPVGLPDFPRWREAGESGALTGALAIADAESPAATGRRRGFRLRWAIAVASLVALTTAALVTSMLVAGPEAEEATVGAAADPAAAAARARTGTAPPPTAAGRSAQVVEPPAELALPAAQNGSVAPGGSARAADTDEPAGPAAASPRRTRSPSRRTPVGRERAAAPAASPPRPGRPTRADAEPLPSQAPATPPGEETPELPELRTQW